MVEDLSLARESNFLISVKKVSEMLGTGRPDLSCSVIRTATHPSLLPTSCNDSKRTLSFFTPSGLHYFRFKDVLLYYPARNPTATTVCD
mgnify:CR=1 FL=1